MFNRRCLALLKVALVLGTSGLIAPLRADEPVPPTKQVERVQSDVSQNYAALYEDDVDTVLKFTHGKVIDLLGDQPRPGRSWPMPSRIWPR